MKTKFTADESLHFVGGESSLFILRVIQVSAISNVCKLDDTGNICIRIHSIFH